MAAGTSEPIIKIEMTKRGIKIVRIETTDNISAHPNALGIAGRSGQLLRDFEQFVDARCILLLIALLLLGLIGLIRIVLRQSGSRRECEGYAESR